MIGGGNGAFIGNVHRHGAIMDDLAELTAGCFTRNMDKNRETAEAWGVRDLDRVYANYEEMAEKEAAREDGIDFISICTPNDTHYPIAKCFLEHGINVMCDKPLALRTEEDRIIATVRDEGPGIRGDISRIFQRFYTDRPDGEHFGDHSGLGLAISKQIIDAHHGTISAQNRTDRSGAIFTITLPRANIERVQRSKK